MSGISLFKKGLAVAVILLFIGVSVIPSTGTVVEKKFTISGFYDGNTLYVGGSGPGNYTMIQDAIDNASNGDTVFVYDDSSPYYENIVVDKSINLVGENRDTTVIDGEGIGNVVTIFSENVNINGLKIQNSSGNGTDSGIMIYSDSNNISDNNISNNKFGIFFIYSNNNIISNNNIYFNIRDGIRFWICNYNNITNNTIISHDEHGMLFYFCNNNTIWNNYISKCLGDGIAIGQHNYRNEFTKNIILTNSGGITIRNTSGNNIFFHNNIINNDHQVQDDSINIWNNTYPIGGNFWDDYNGVDNDGDGIGDTPYDIPGGSNQDLYPLMYPYGNRVINIDTGEEFSTIQGAIDDFDTLDGHTIFAENGMFCENVVIHKSINLIGEDKENTIIDGGGSDDVVYVSADNVNVSGLTIQNSGTYPNSCVDIRSNMCVFVNNIIINPEGWGFDLKNSNYNSIYRTNIQSGRGIGIFLENSFHITISENILTNIDGDCIWLTKSSNNSIYDNIISENYHGIYLRDSENNSINENTVYNNVAGMYFSNSSGNNTISGNTIASNQYDGIDIHSSNGVISANTISSNGGKGIRSYSESNNNRLYHNNFINNTISASDEGNNKWDNGYPSGGNYWDDYNGVDNNGDGIGDTPYNILGGDNQDRYPLMEPFVQHPEFDVSGRGGIGLKISITNVGDIAATNVEWSVSAKGGLFGLINLSENGSLNSLDMGESISLTLMPFGFGFLTVSIEIDASYAEKQTFKGHFFVILFIVFPTIPPLCWSSVQITHGGAHPINPTDGF